MTVLVLTVVVEDQNIIFGNSFKNYGRQKLKQELGVFFTFGFGKNTWLRLGVGSATCSGKGFCCGIGRCRDQ